VIKRQKRIFNLSYLEQERIFKKWQLYVDHNVHCSPMKRLSVAANNYEQLTFCSGNTFAEAGKVLLFAYIIFQAHQCGFFFILDQ